MKTTFTFEATELASIVLDYLIDTGKLEEIDGEYRVTTQVGFRKNQTGYEAMFSVEALDAKSSK